MRKIINRGVSLLLVVITALFLPVAFSSCVGAGPWELNNIVWYSEDPVMEIVDMTGKRRDGTIIVDGEQIQMRMLWGFSYSYEIIDLLKDDGNTPVDNIALIWGRMEYESGIVTLIVEGDKLFNYKYDQIILKYRNLPESE